MQAADDCHTRPLTTDTCSFRAAFADLEEAMSAADSSHEAGRQSFDQYRDCHSNRVSLHLGTGPSSRRPIGPLYVCRLENRKWAGTSCSAFPTRIDFPGHLPQLAKFAPATYRAPEAGAPPRRLASLRSPQQRPPMTLSLHVAWSRLRCRGRASQTVAAKRLFVPHAQPGITHGSIGFPNTQ